MLWCCTILRCYGLFVFVAAAETLGASEGVGIKHLNLILFYFNTSIVQKKVYKHCKLLVDVRFAADCIQFSCLGAQWSSMEFSFRLLLTQTSVTTALLRLLTLRSRLIRFIIHLFFPPSSADVSLSVARKLCWGCAVVGTTLNSFFFVCGESSSTSCTQWWHTVSFIWIAEQPVITWLIRSILEALAIAL